MDAKITKQRLGRMLSYDWIKIALFAAVAIIVWSLVFTMTATRITPAQQFSVFNYAGNTVGTKFHDSYENAFRDGVFSHEVLEVNCNDLSTSNEYLNTVLEARLTTDEGDVIFLADADNPDTEYEENGEKKYDSYLYSFVSHWGYYLMDLDPQSEKGYFRQMEMYLARYYTDGYKNPESLDTARVEADFRARIKQNKDKRYKNEQQIQKGVQGDIERIQKYRDALDKFLNVYVAKGYVSFTKTEVPNGEKEGEMLFSGIYSINLCPNVETMGGLKDIVSYRETYVDEADGLEKIRVTAENMNIALFDLKGVEAGFEYESLLYVNYVIESVCTELKA